MRLFPLTQAMLRALPVVRDEANLSARLAELAGTKTAAATPAPAPRRDPLGDLLRLRACWRILTRNRRPEQENIFLAAGLLALGHHARLVVGREAAPAGPARYLSWVCMNEEVLTTGLPVDETHVPVATLPLRQ